MPFLLLNGRSRGIGAADQRTGERNFATTCHLHSGRSVLATVSRRSQCWFGLRQGRACASAALAPAPPPSSAGASSLLAGPSALDAAAVEAAAQRASWVPPAGRPGLWDADGRLVLKALTLPELEAWCAAEGEPSPANRALQLWRWMYADPPAGAWVRSLEETAGRQNGFSAKFIEKVGPRVSLDGGLALQRVVRASDGTRKLVFGLTCGPAAGGSIEAVLIPVVRRAGLRDRLTLCVSSQVGCAMNCQFCYTGRMGLLGNLTTAQIVEQVVEARRFLAEEGDRTPLTNLVFMGMGEPLHNTEAVLAAAEIVGHYLGLHISHNKMTISTVGLVPEMRTVLARSRVQMALSLHATTDEVRDWIVPVNRRYDLATLTAALQELFPKPEANAEPATTEAASSAAAPAATPAAEAVPSAAVAAAAAAAEVGLSRGESEERAQEAAPSRRPPQSEAVGQGCCSQEGGPDNNNGPGKGSSAPSVATAHAATLTATAEAAAGPSPSPLPCCAPAPADMTAGPDAAPAAAGPGPEAMTHGSGGEAGEASSSGRWLPPLEAHAGERSATSGGAAEGRAAAAASGSSSSGRASDAVAEHGADGAASSTGDSAADSVGSGGVDGSIGRGAAVGGSGRVERSLLVEYTMLHGINDTLEDAERLASMLSRVNCKVNLIVFNPHAGTRFQPSTDEDVCAFRSALIRRGLVCTIRDSRGDDEMAACGQLGNVGLAFRPSPLLEPPERFRRFLLPPPSLTGQAAPK